MFRQILSTVIKVKGMEVKEFDKKDGSGKLIVLETKGTLVPEGVYVTVSKMISLKPNLHAFIQGQIDKFKNDILTFDGNQETGIDTYAKVFFKPKEKKVGNVLKVEQYDKIYTDILEDGREFLKIDSWVSLLESGKEGEREFVVFESMRGNKKIFIDQLTPSSLEVTMLVLSQQEDRVLLTSGGDYPKELVIYTNPESKVKGKAKIGQGYKFILGFTKGKRLGNIVTDEAVDVSWDAPAAKSTGSSFEKDKLTIYGVGIEKGFILGGMSDVDPMDAMMDMLG